jgi:SsrA-binding protein
MGKKKKKPDSTNKMIANNKKARYNFYVDDELEVGIVLKGSEVKSLRAGEANIADSYADQKDGEIFLINCYIKEYDKANIFNHDSRRPRKLLLHKREITKLAALVQKKGMTLVPLKLYFNDVNRVKLLLGICRGKKQHDKRATEKDRDWNRQKSRIMKDMS